MRMVVWRKKGHYYSWAFFLKWETRRQKTLDSACHLGIKINFHLEEVVYLKVVLSSVLKIETAQQGNLQQGENLEK